MYKDMLKDTCKDTYKDTYRDTYKGWQARKLRIHIRVKHTRVVAPARAQAHI